MVDDEATDGAGVLFDIDGTLLDTNYLHVLAWWHAIRDAGHGDSSRDISMACVHRAIGIGSEELVQRLLGREDERAVKGHGDRVDGFKDRVTAFPKAAELLAACQERGLTVVLATSAKSADLDWMLPAIGAGDAVAGSTTSEDVEAAKPAPDLLGTAVRQHSLDPRRTVVVGDTVWDVESARKADLPCIGLTCGGISRQELTEAGAVEVYDDPEDLLGHLEESLLGKAHRRL